MTANKNCVEQQVKNKIKSYNRQRIGVTILGGISIAILIFSPAFADATFFMRLSVLCSAWLLLCSLALIISGRNAMLFFLITTTVLAALLIFKQRQFELFLILTLINTGTFMISKKISSSFIQSVTNEIKTISRLEIEATTDSLTQLLNRNGLDKALETAWAFCKRNKKNVGFILIDIDYFKSYNDILGHLEGDKILKQVAGSIRTCFRRESDIISRFGGDEFLICLSDINDSQIVEKAQLFSATITNLKIKAIVENNPSDFLSVSMGIITCLPQPYDSLIDFYKRVDKSLYHAKQNGGNCISFNGNIIESIPRQSPDNITDIVHSISTLKTGFACEDSEG